MAEKTNSELLLEIRTDVDRIKKSIELLNFQYSVILNRLNAIADGTAIPVKPNPAEKTYGSVTSVENPPPVEQLQGADRSRRNASGQKFDFNDPPARPKDNEDVVEDRTPVVPEHSARQVPVTQVLYTAQGKPMTLANIDIKDDKNNLIKKVRTNNVGRWNTLIPEGKYTLFVTRRYNDEVVEFKQEVSIEYTGKPVNLSPPEEYTRKTK